jgi:hypothetical protein
LKLGRASYGNMIVRDTGRLARLLLSFAALLGFIVGLAHLRSTAREQQYPCCRSDEAARIAMAAFDRTAAERKQATRAEDARLVGRPNWPKAKCEGLMQLSDGRLFSIEVDLKRQILKLVHHYRP